MTALIGALIIISGFLSPFFSEGEIPSILFFWIGFLVLFSSRKRYPRQALWMKWARFGVIANAVGELILIQCLNLVLAMKHNNIAAKILIIGSYILSPISRISTVLFPHPSVESAGGTVTVVVSYLRATATSFFDVLTYISIGILVGKLLLIRKAEKVNEK